MATEKQKTGKHGERLVVKSCSCPKCKRLKTLKLLPTNFKCADVICDFCGYMAQVKSSLVNDVDKIPNEILGAAWGPQKERMDAGIYFPLFIVLIIKNGRKHSIFYLAADLQSPNMFVKRKKLSQTARRAGWQGFKYNMALVRDAVVRLK